MSQALFSNIPDLLHHPKHHSVLGILNKYHSHRRLLLHSILNITYYFLLLFIFILFLTENLSRKKAKYHLETRGGFKIKQKIKLNGVKSFVVFLLEVGFTYPFFAYALALG